MSARRWRHLLMALPLLLAAADHPAGYLGGQVVDVTGIVPPAPIPGDIRDDADRRVFRAMKRWIGSPRWAAATTDADYGQPALERDFSCAAGLMLTPAALPALARLLANAGADASRANGLAKDFWRRPRPYRFLAGETCQPKAELGNSYDYPSGHTMLGWTYGLVLADVLPERTVPLLARARAYSESRFVCRVHSYSAVENGRLGATAVLARVRATPGYLQDLAAARAEVAAARTTLDLPDPVVCATAKRLLTPSPLGNLRR